MEGVVALLLIATLKKLVDFVRQLRAGKEGVNAVATQVLAWVGGVVLVILVSHSGFADSINFGDQTLAGAGFGTQVIFGLAFASAASFAQDVLASVDNTRTSKVPALIPTAEAETKDPIA